MKYLYILILALVGYTQYSFESQSISCQRELPIVIDTIPQINSDSIVVLKEMILDLLEENNYDKTPPVVLKRKIQETLVSSNSLVDNIPNTLCSGSLVEKAVAVIVTEPGPTVPVRAKFYTEHPEVNQLEPLLTTESKVEVMQNNCFMAIQEEVIVETKKVEVLTNVLTAAEWNDLTNWEDWRTLMEDGVYTQMLDYWNLPMGKRQSVFVTNPKNIPLPNCELSLIGRSGNILWTSLTDHQGRAELWFPTKAQEQVTLVARAYDETVSLSLPAGEFDSDQHLILNAECNSHETVDLMFLVDATGSMSDEIAYLKAELADVIRHASESTEMDFRTGAVFYKDKWDDYLTAVSPLHHDPQVAIDFMHKRSISGGGDYPEAVEAGLEKALNQEWDEDALSRIIFLLLDAPPHDDQDVLARLENQVRTAAEKGIKIIPITASGIDRETEYLMKQMAMMTNGTYIFLTDDSGIGESHLTHAIPDYDVEKLNELLIRLISGYATGSSCDQTIEDTVVEISKDQKEKLSVKLYPNPTVDRLNLELSTAVDKVIITTSTGRRAHLESGLSVGIHTIDVSSLVSGKYYLTLVKAGKEVKVIPFLIIS